MRSLRLDDYLPGHGLAPVLATLFVAHQRSRVAPLVHLGLFRQRTFAVGSLVGMAFTFVPRGSSSCWPSNLLQGRGYSALFSGTVFAAVGVGYFIAMGIAGGLAARMRHRVLALGAVLVLVGFGFGLVLGPALVDRTGGCGSTARRVRCGRAGDRSRFAGLTALPAVLSQALRSRGQLSR